MTDSQGDTVEDVAKWVRGIIGSGNDVTLIGKAREQMDWHRIAFSDVIYVLERCKDVRQDYNGGCYTVRDDVADQICVAVVITPKNDRNCIKVINVWRE